MSKSLNIASAVKPNENGLAVVPDTNNFSSSTIIQQLAQCGNSAPAGRDPNDLKNENIPAQNNMLPKDKRASKQRPHPLDSKNFSQPSYNQVKRANQNSDLKRHRSDPSNQHSNFQPPARRK